MEPWRDCAPCHPLSDGGAGKRYANLVLINRPDQGLLNSRRMDRRRFPTASGPSVGAPHPCRWIASGLSEAPSTRNPPCPSPPRSILSRYSTVTTCFGGFGLKGSGNDTIPVVQFYGLDYTNRGQARQVRDTNANLLLGKGNRYLLFLKENGSYPGYWSGTVHPYKFLLKDGRAKVESPVGTLTALPLSSRRLIHKSC